MANTLGEKIILSEELVSSGFKIDFAIATTYSLDLEYLLSTTAALGLLGDMDDLLKRSPYYQMEAIQRSNYKMLVFSNASSIHSPKKDSKLFSLLEDCIKPICLSTSANDIVNFHAKVWIIKETSEQDGYSQIKVIVSSRNLSPSSEINAACMVTGKIGKQPKHLRQTKPLIDFVSWLKENSHCSIKQKKQMGTLEEALDKVNSWNMEMDNTPRADIVNNISFIPLGIGEDYDGDYCINLFAKSRQALIVSPFIDRETSSEVWRNLLKRSGGRLLLTREEQLAESVFEAFNKRDGVYVVKEEMHGDYANSDIHAKMFFLNADDRNHLLLGSANATHNGFRRNVEFMVDILYRPGIISYWQFLKELITDERNCMFERLTTLDDTAIDNNEDDEVLIRQTVINLQRSKAITVADGNLFRIELTTKNIGEAEVFIHPLHKSSQRQRLSSKNVFNDMDLLELCELFVVDAEGKERIVKIPVKNLPRAERDNAIKNSVIRTKADFIDYINFLLSDTPDTYILQREENRSGKDNRSKANEILPVDFYEQMLKLTSSDPQRVIDIRQRFQGVKEEIMPADFIDVYTIFEQSAKQSKNERA